MILQDKVVMDCNAFVLHYIVYELRIIGDIVGKGATINARIEPKLKHEAESILHNVGL